MADVNHKAAMRGRKAAVELEETGAAFAAVEAAMMAELRKTPIGNDLKILKLHAGLQCLDALREALMRTVTAGKTAEIYAEAAEAVAEGFGGSTETP